jgi:AcrR family transcriptional regulator
VGIDRVTEHACVAKASLYAHFRSKDELERAYLQSPDEARRARMLERIHRHRSPRERSLAVFDSVAETMAQPGFRGWLRELFTDLLREAGVRNPRALAQQFVRLFDGGSWRLRWTATSVPSVSHAPWQPACLMPQAIALADPLPTPEKALGNANHDPRSIPHAPCTDHLASSRQTH